LESAHEQTENKTLNTAGMYGKETWMRMGTKRGTEEQEEGGRGGKDSGKQEGKANAGEERTERQDTGEACVDE